MTKIISWPEEQPYFSRPLGLILFFEADYVMEVRKILCAIDFSESSLSALKWTLDTAYYFNAEVTVLFCYRLIQPLGDKEIPNIKQDMENTALAKFREIEKGLKNGRCVSYQFVSEVGFLPTRVETFIDRSPVSLVVMGNEIIPKFNEYKSRLFEQFLSSSKVPVVIVPAGAQEFPELPK